MGSRHDFVEKKTRRDAVGGLLMFVHVWINCIAIDLTHFLSDNEAALWAASSQMVISIFAVRLMFAPTTKHKQITTEGTGSESIGSAPIATKLGQSALFKLVDYEDQLLFMLGFTWNL